MTLDELFDLFWVSFDKAKAPFLLIGGFAVNCYGARRATMDVDFLATEEAYDKALPQVEEKGCREIFRNELFAKVAVPDSPFKVDVLFVDKKTFDQLFQGTKEFELGGRKFLAPSLEHLIALKLHAAKQDLEGRNYRDLGDILVLVKENQVDIQTSQFKELCLKFGTNELYEMIRKAVKQ